ncbi:MAG: efflux RND transporter permease subunit [Azospirillaceae bacterium]
MQTRGPDIAALSVRRPTLAVVFSLLIVVAGLAALYGVDIRELPDVDRPVIYVSTTYDGAAPETVDTQVTSIVEGAVARVPGVSSISSNSEQGRSRVTIEFDPSVDLTTAASDVRDAVSGIERQLPDDADAPTVVKSDSDSSPIIRLSVTSATRNSMELTDLVNDVIANRLAAVDGVASIEIYGDTEPVLRVLLDPIDLASRGIGFADLVAILDRAAFDVPVGNFDAEDQRLSVRATADITSAAGVAGLRIDANTRVGDIAFVDAAPMERTTMVRVNGATVIGLGVVRQAQSNTIEISRGVNAAIEQLRLQLPEDVEIAISSDDATFIQGSIDEVAFTLVLATLIVIAVIYVFVASFRATLIPAVTMPVALIGTIACIWIFGFSINILTLLALVLATGIVVDDAIVVLENIERLRAMGAPRRAAAVLGTRQVFFAVLATTATLAAVFVPISFLPGTAGRLFAEFGFVLAIAVAISSFVALTLCPMLASRLPEGDGSKPLVSRLLGAIGRPLARLYAGLLTIALAAPLVTLTLASLIVAAAISLFRDIPTELLPQEDRGILFMSISMPTGSSLDYADRQVSQVEDLFDPLIETGEVRAVFSVVRGGGSAFVIVRLADWDERERSQQEIVADLVPGINQIPGARIFVRSPNSLGIRGGGSGLSFALTGSEYDSLALAADDFAATIQDQVPGVQGTRVSYEVTQPQLSIEVDREAATDIGVPLSDLSAILGALIDGGEVGEVFVGGDAVPIRVEPRGGILNDPSDIGNLYITTNDGRSVPLSSVITLSERASAPSLTREGQRRAISVSVTLDPTMPLGTAVEAVSALAVEALPDGVGLIFTGDAAALNETTSGVAITFAVAIVVIFLVLAAQFESFVSAFVILATLPFGLAAAVFALYLTGSSLNIYSQIGLVMLIGLMAKNGILVVEFANQLRDRGMAVAEAAREAAIVRLRPVLMTMISTVLGGLPLVLSSGAGAEARQAIGWLVVGGLGFSTLFTLFLTPVAYVLLGSLSTPRAEHANRLEAELAEAERRGVTI